MFADALSKLQNLVELSIVLYKTKLNDDGIEHLCKSLGRMNKLENLILTFGKTKIVFSHTFSPIGLGPRARF